ncbi:MAG: CheR family methyltransferase [Candidatus Kariarchaeaceae archaeon]
MRSSDRYSKSNGADETDKSISSIFTLSDLQKKLEMQQEVINKKNTELSHILSASRNDPDDVQEVQQRKINGVTLSSDIDDPSFQSNIQYQQTKKGKRITLQERIDKRRQNPDKTTDSSQRKEYKDSEYIPHLSKYFQDHGIPVLDYRENYYIRSLAKRLLRLNLSSYLDYLEYLKTTPSELKLFRDSLSINVTRFFRDRDVWDFLRDDVFSKLIGSLKNEGKKQQLNIWSAGCAVGAEPYSLAMICQNLSYKIPRHIKIQITATDIKQELLNQALMGIYSEEYLPEMNQSDILTHFIIDKDQAEIKSHLKQMVSFSKLDLVNHEFPEYQHLIVCRNVLIYMDKAAKAKIFDKFYQSLLPGGFLVIGKSESIQNGWRDHVSAYSIPYRVYQKL